MPLFRFKPADATGEVVEGEMEAADREALVERLRGQGQITIRAQERALVLVAQVTENRGRPPDLLSCQQLLVALARRQQ